MIVRWVVSPLPPFFLSPPLLIIPHVHVHNYGSRNNRVLKGVMGLVVARMPLRLQLCGHEYNN